MLMSIDRIVSENALGSIVLGVAEVDGQPDRRVRARIRASLFEGRPRIGECWEIEGPALSTKWGSQVEVTAARRRQPTGRLLRAFLAGTVPGIGPARANRLWEAFGRSLEAVLADEANVQVVAEALSGDRPAMAARLAALVISEWKAASAETAVIAWLDSVGLSDLRFARRIARLLGDDTRVRLEANPYIMVPFAPWTRVDGLGKRLLAKQGVERPTTDTRRLVGAVDAAVKGLISEGHTATSRPDLLQSLGRKVGSLSEQAIDAGISVGALIADAELLRFPGCALMEDACLVMLRELYANAMPLPRSVLKDFRDGTLVHSGGLHAEQHAAALRVLLHPVACLQGGAGTGKSFVTRTICAAWEVSGGSVVLAALSGKAALRLSRASGRLAMTLARLLRNLEAQCETDGAKSSAVKDEDAVVLDDRTLVVVDEAAMVDLPTMYRLLGYMNGRGRLLLVGDDAQLPPIGFGLVYHRLVENVETTARLTVVHRQSGESGIPSVAASIRERRMPALSAYAGKVEGVSFVDVRGDGIAEAVELVSDDLGGFGQGELMVVTATNGGPAGIDELNSRLQRRHVERNGHTVVKGSLGQWFAPADPCIHLRNDYSLGLFNGSTGQVVEVSEEDRAVTAEIDGRRFRFTSQIAGDDVADGDLVDLGLAYALTCHKAQGSQCSRVIVPVYRTALLTPSWLYTAVTRAERQVVLVGEREAIELALSRPWVGEARTVGIRPLMNGISLISGSV